MRKEKKFKKEQFMVYFIAFIMISSVFGVVFYGFSGGGDTTAEYNGFSFSRDQQVNSKWSTKIDDKEVSFDYFPTEVLQYNISSEIINRLKGTMEIDVTYDVMSKRNGTFAYFSYDMQQQLSDKGTYVRPGFVAESEFDIPVITCEDATVAVPVIHIKESDDTSVYLDGNCIILEAKSDFDFIRIKDGLLYGIYGVIE